MQPEIVLGPITLQTFGLALAAAFIGSGIVTGRRLVELGKPVDWAYEALFAAIIGGLVGARVDWLIQNAGDLEGGIFANLFSGAGLVFFGGVIGGVVAVLIWAYWRGFANLALVDMAAPALAIGYAVGRIGCQLSGDGDYGIPWDGPWAMAYPNGTVPTDVPVHPTPVYETLVMGLFAWALWQLRDRFQPGALFAIWLVGAGTERLLIEIMRVNDTVVAGLTQPQLIAIAMMIGGIAWLAVIRSRAGTLRWPQGADRRERLKPGLRPARA
ncbi:prolipoprotein diacylglyceryl transferase [Thermoleophilia bacterium SCSIO 60948]|nr:prolipoprotein diacylglyceryl transferase [Thermoleophilia bacterium SCSIO 60948]